MAETKSILIDTKTCSNQTRDHYHTWTYSTINSKLKSAGLPSNAVLTSVVLRVVGRHEWTSVLGGNANITISAWFCPDDSSKYMSGINLISATRFTNTEKDATYSSSNIVKYFNTKSPFNITESTQARLSVYFDSSNQIERTYYTSTYLDVTYDIHNHSYTTETSRKPATCLASGSVTKQCSCGATQTTTLAQLSHSYTGAIKSNGNGKTATHSFKCVNGCNNYGGAVTHTWNSGVQTTAPTCTATGVKTYTCTASGCGGKYTETIPAKGHTVVHEPEIPPTCTESGQSSWSYCSDCGEVLSHSMVLPSLGHDYVPTVTQPTESSKGYTTNTCSRCGDSYVDKYTCLLTLKANNNEYGTVSGGKIYNQGETVTIIATANADYMFVSWNDGVTLASRVISVTDSVAYTAYFKLNAVYVDLVQSLVYTDTKESEIYVDETIVYE